MQIIVFICMDFVFFFFLYSNFEEPFWSRTITFLCIFRRSVYYFSCLLSEIEIKIVKKNFTVIFSPLFIFVKKKV